MASPFGQGVERGAKLRMPNPFDALIQHVSTIQDEKRAMDQKIELEANELKSLFKKMGVEQENAKEIQRLKGEQDIGLERDKTRLKGVPVSKAGGLLQAAGMSGQGREVDLGNGEILFVPESIGEEKDRLDVELKRRQLAETTPEGAREKGESQGIIESKKDSFKMSEKMATAVRRLDVVRNQSDVALPSGGRSSAGQRINGVLSVFGAKTGIKPNKELLALIDNARPMAINIVRLFGEVGNLSRTEQDAAIKTIEQAGLTEDERKAKIKQFIEFSIAGADPDVKNYLLQQEDISGILRGLGINIQSSSQGQQGIFNSMSNEELEAILNE